MFGRSQVRIGPGSNNTVRTRQEIAGSSPKVIGSLPGVRRELTKGAQELAGSTSGVHRKMIERLTGSSPEDAEKFIGSSEDRL
ncbi:hypothetical protein GW17_00053360, partial [Ensete ventricosum]